jgi:hypothetical protein
MPSSQAGARSILKFIFERFIRKEGEGEEE